MDGGARPAPAASSPTAFGTEAPPAVAPGAARAVGPTSLCWPAGRPAAEIAPSARRNDACRPFDPAELARTEARIRKDFVIYEPPSKLVIDFDCDAAASDTREVVFESGSGHGGNLRIVRFQREEATPRARYAVRLIDSQHNGTLRLEVRTASIDARTFDAVVARARVAAVARPHAVKLVDPKGGLGLSGTFSSNDFHLRITIVDDQGEETDRAFTGYESSDEQEAYLPMRIAAEPIQQLLGAAAFVTVAPTDIDRDLFTARLLATMSGKPSWWIAERYVGVAAKLGTPAGIPALVRVLKANGGASEPRAREAAVDAIAAITGWNPRLDRAGRVRGAAAAAAAAVAECEPSLARSRKAP